MGTHKAAAFILGIFLFAGFGAFGYFLNKTAVEYKMLDRTVTVKGLSEREYPADIVIWPISYRVISNNLQRLYEKLDDSTLLIKNFLRSEGFNATEITVSQPLVEDKVANAYNAANITYRFKAKRTITVYSHDINKTRAAMGHIAKLGKQGVSFSGYEYDNRVEYIFTRLNEVKPQMIEEATKKAREVAEKFAADSRSKLGKIKQARQGQFSIMQRDQNNPHIKKVRIVSTIEYYLSD